MPVFQVKATSIEIVGADEHGHGPGRARRGCGMQTAQLLRTLDLLPVGHLRLLPRITVGERPPSSGNPGSYGGGGSAHHAMAGGPYLRLNWRIFDAPWNRNMYNETLLHEVGHFVDWGFQCMTTMQREDRAGFDALVAHPHSGRTEGPGEHYADAYADHFKGRNMSAGRRRALLNSSGFSDIQSVPDGVEAASALG